MTKILSLSICIMSFFGAIAQGNLSGKVLSDGEPVIGADILIKGTTRGTTTDINGFFFLETIPAGNQIVVFSFIGFEDNEINTTIVNNKTISLGIIELEEGQLINEIVIEGEIVEGDKQAIKMMLESKHITQIKSAETIAKLPDKNAAEALQRMPGIVMESDHGEGQYISFRGTPPDWSTVTINGNRMPVANEEVIGRALNLDVLPTSLLDFIEYNQTLLPNIEADAIGGNANFVTRKVPDEFTLQIEAGSGFNEKAQKPVYNFSVLAGGRTKNKKFGFVGGASYFARNWSTDNYEIFYGSNVNQALTRLELRKYNGLRTTFGAHFKMDYKPNKNNTFYVMGFNGQMRDNEYNRKTMYNWSTGVGQSIRVTSIHNILQHQMYGGALGAKNNVSEKLSINWEVGSYLSKFSYGNVPFDNNDPRNGYYVLEYEKIVEFTDFLYLDENGNQVTINDDYDQRFKLLDYDSPFDNYGDAYNNIQPAYQVNPNPLLGGVDTMFTLLKAYTETNANQEIDPIVANIELDYKARSNLTLSFGAKYRYKTGTRRIGIEAWQPDPFNSSILTYDLLALEDIPRNDDFLAEAGGNYRNYALQFVEQNQLNNFIEDNEDQLVYLPFNENTPFYPQFVGSSFNYSESAASVFGMANWDASTTLNLTGGLRVEYTNATVIADSVIEVLNPTGDTQFELVEISAKKPYTAILPMVSLNWEFAKRAKIVYGFSRSYRRVNFNEIKPGEPEIHYTHFHLLRGNPNLRPTFSINNDVSIQKYFGLSGYVSATVFHKYVTDHIYTAFESGNVDGNTTAGAFVIPGGIVAKRYENAPTANVYGFEVAFEGTLKKIKPRVLKHFGLGFNYAFTESSMKIDSREAKQPLTRQAKHVVNARLSYESNPIEVNVGLNYRSPYLLELNLFAYTDPITGEVIIRQSNDYDIFMGRNLGLDASILYNISKRMAINLELMNLLNTEFVEYRGVRQRPVKTEYYGIRGLISFKYNIGRGESNKTTTLNQEHHNHNH